MLKKGPIWQILFCILQGKITMHFMTLLQNLIIRYNHSSATKCYTLVLETAGEKWVLKLKHKLDIRIKTILNETGCEVNELMHDILMTRFCDVSIMTGNFWTTSIIQFFIKSSPSFFSLLSLLYYRALWFYSFSYSQVFFLCTFPSFISWLLS